MSEALTVNNPMAQHADAIINAAEDLADALSDVRDAAFGYTALTLDVINDILRRAGVRVEPIR